MASGTLAARTNGQTIDQTWFNQFRDALNQDQYARNSSGVATDQAGSLGTSSYRFLNAYLMNMYLMDTTHFIKQKAPSGLAVDYTVQWPGALPGSTLPLQITSGGILTFAQLPTGGILDNAVTQAKLEDRSTGTTVGAGGVAVSASSGSYTRAGVAGQGNVTNLSVTITTTGRPVLVFLTGVSGSGASVKFENTSSAFGHGGTIYFRRDASSFYTPNFDVLPQASVNSLAWPPSSFCSIDQVVAGTYTYDVQASVSNTSSVTCYVTNCQLVAYEI